MDHFISKCKHGRVVTQCRCIGPKEVRIVPCVSRKCLVEAPIAEKQK